MWGIFTLSVVSVCIPFVNCFRGFLVGPERWLVLDIRRCDNPEQYEIQIDIKSRKKNRTHNCFDFSMDTVREFDVTYGVSWCIQLFKIYKPYLKNESSYPAWGDFGKLLDVLKSKRVPINLKHRMFEQCVLVMTYGANLDAHPAYYPPHVEIEVYQEVDGGFIFHHEMKFDSLCTKFKETSEENMKRLFTMANIDPPDCPLPPGSIKVNNFVMDYGELPKICVYGTFEARVHVMYEEKRVGCLRLILNFEIRDDEENVENESGATTKLKSILRG